MKTVPQRIILDDANRPVAVEIAYDDWLRIEALLLEHEPPVITAADLGAFAGTVAFGEDGVAYQRRLRDEWS